MEAKRVGDQMCRHLRSNRPPIVVLTGAGISAESGLSTFRGDGGLWAGHRVEDVASPSAFERDPDLVYEFYNLRRRNLLSIDVKPNAAHKALERLQSEWSERVTIITQNVDDLHERAGSSNVIHMHGELLKIRHLDSGEVRSWNDDCDGSTLDGRWRPHIVWFGEAILETAAISEALMSAGLFLCIGTAGQVYPAAGFIHEVAGPSVEFNIQRTAISKSFTDAVLGSAAEHLPIFVDALLK